MQQHKVISLLAPKLSTLMDSSLQEGDGGVTGIDTSPPSSPLNFVSGSSLTAAGSPFFPPGERIKPHLKVTSNMNNVLGNV